MCFISLSCSLNITACVVIYMCVVFFRAFSLFCAQKCSGIFLWFWGLKSHHKQAIDICAELPAVIPLQSLSIFKQFKRISNIANQYCIRCI